MASKYFNIIPAAYVRRIFREDLNQPTFIRAFHGTDTIARMKRIVQENGVSLFAVSKEPITTGVTVSSLMLFGIFAVTEQDEQHVATILQTYTVPGVGLEPVHIEALRAYIDAERLAVQLSCVGPRVAYMYTVLGFVASKSRLYSINPRVTENDENVTVLSSQPFGELRLRDRQRLTELCNLSLLELATGQTQHCRYAIAQDNDRYFRDYDNERTTTYVYRVGLDIAGLLRVCHHATLPQNDVVEFIVHPEYRHSGVGSALLSRAVADGRDVKRGTYITAEHAQCGLMKLLAKQGFTLADIQYTYLPEQSV